MKYFSVRLSVFGSILLALIIFGYFLVCSNDATIENIRDKHASFLANSPFKKTLQLSKSERKALRIPPNKYYEREWELTMNPETGKPEPFKTLELQSELNSANYALKTPGTSMNDWVERGPDNVGGRTRVVLFDPNDSTYKRVFAGGVSGGLWKNEDITNPNSPWNEVTGVPNNMNISCLTVDPNDTNIWYLGTGEHSTYGAAVGNGVYKTTDGGVNWTHITVSYITGALSTDLFNVFPGIFFINDIIAWDNSGNTELFLGVGASAYLDANPLNWLGTGTAGLYKSSDAGISWTRQEAANLTYPLALGNTVYAIYYIPNDFEIGADNSLWMGTIGTFGLGPEGGGRVFHSTDGVDWTQKAQLPNSNRVELAVSDTEANKLYALTEGTDGVPHIFATTDAFTSIIELAKPVDADKDILAEDFTRNQDYYNLVIETDPNNDAILYVGGIDLFRSTSGTTTDQVEDWEQISKWSNNNFLQGLSCSVVHADQHAMAFRPGVSDQAVFGNDGGVYFASSLSAAANNPVITSRNTNYNVTQFYYGSYGQDVLSEQIVAGSQDNGTQLLDLNLEAVNPGVQVFGGDGAFCEIDKDGNYMIVSYVYNNYAYLELPYTDEGYFINEDTEGAEGDFINQAALDPVKDVLFTNGSNLSENYINRYILGQDSAEKTVLTNELLTGSPTAFKVSPFTTKSTTLLVGTDTGKLLKITNANQSNTSLISWEDLGGYYFTTDEMEAFFVGSISDIEFGSSENEIIVTIHNYNVTSVFMTTNGGVYWSSKEGNLPDIPIKCFLQNPLAKNEAIVGTELGVWTTANFQESSPNWTHAYNGMKDVKVVDLDLRTTDNNVLATTFGRGLFTGGFTAETLPGSFVMVPENSVVSTCTDTAVFNFLFEGDVSGITGFSISFADALEGKASVALNFSNFPECSLTISGIQANSVDLGTHAFRLFAAEGQKEANFVDFAIQVEETVGTFQSMQPEANEIIPPDELSFQWAHVEGATSYTIEISQAANFSVMFDTATTLNNFYTNSNDFEDNTQYYWRVLAQNHCGASYSQTNTFRTSGLLGNEQPNPVNGNIVIYPTVSNGVFYMNANMNLGETQIEVVNASGNSVYQDAIFISGTTTLFLDLTHLPTGLYRIKCNNNTETEIIEVIIK